VSAIASQTVARCLPRTLTTCIPCETLPPDHRGFVLRGHLRSVSYAGAVYGLLTRRFGTQSLCVFDDGLLLRRANNGLPLLSTKQC